MTTRTATAAPDEAPRRPGTSCENCIQYRHSDDLDTKAWCSLWTQYVHPAHWCELWEAANESVEAYVKKLERTSKHGTA